MIFLLIMAVRAVKVTFGNNPGRIKIISLPVSSTTPDVINLKNALLKEMLVDGSIESLGGNEETTIRDFVAQHIDPDFGEVAEIPTAFVIPHKHLVTLLLAANIRTQPSGILLFLRITGLYMQ